MTMSQKKRATRTHSIAVEVTENIDHAMYLRSSFGSGQTEDGTPIEVDISGSTLLIMIGKWGSKEGRQFTIDTTALIGPVVDLAKAK